MSNTTNLRAYIGSNTAIRRYLLPDSSKVTEDGRLSIGGCDVLELAEQYGTPLFVYDEQHLRNRCHEALSAFGDGVAYGGKAFLCKEMARLVNEEGLLLDVATGGEAYVAMMAGVPPDRMVMHGNNKSEEEIGTALHAGIGRIVIDSFAELDRIERIAGELGGTPKVSVRVTPGVEAHTHEYVMTGQTDSKFGLGLLSGEAATAVQRVKDSPVMELVGIHAHIGSQIFLLHSFVKAIELLAPFVRDAGVDELCLGGGLGVPYVEGEEAPTITEWAKTLKDACAEHGITARIAAEPGRSIAATAGVTLYRVGTIKDILGVRTYVSVDGGMSDNPRPVLYGSGYEAFLPRLTLSERSREVTIVGKHCESGDVVVRDARVPQELESGDILCTPVTGAYGYSMASNYNKVPRPAVVFVRGGDSRIVVRRETYEDLIRLDE
ncbi:MAG: diaminopimelate decarboxylase [Acidimicrobiia bacterium]|nr:diaminopimelate decarboxylase [Acidimicrobiia bacterium]